MSAVSLQFQVSHTNSIQEAWDHALDKGNEAFYPNQELISYINHSFKVGYDHKWPDWINENVRQALIQAAKLPDSNSIAAFGQALYPKLEPEDLISLYRLFDFHEMNGDKKQMLERGRLAYSLVQNLK